MGCAAHCNPFRVQRTDALAYRAVHEPWPRAMGRLTAMGWRGAVVGPHGTGKTTLLGRLAEDMARQGFVVQALRFSEADGPLDAAWRGALKQAVAAHGRDLFVLLDGAEQLGAVGWRHARWLTRAAGGLVITTHHAGRLPTWMRTGADASMLMALVDELLERAAAEGEIDDPASGGLDESTADALLQSTGGDMRAALRTLYDRWADST